MHDATMLRRPTAEQAERLKRRGIFDVGVTTLSLTALERPVRYRFWDGYVPPEERDD